MNTSEIPWDWNSLFSKKTVWILSALSQSKIISVRWINHLENEWFYSIHRNLAFPNIPTIYIFSIFEPFFSTTTRTWFCSINVSMGSFTLIKEGLNEEFLFNSLHQKIYTLKYTQSFLKISLFKLGNSCLFSQSISQSTVLNVCRPNHLGQYRCVSLLGNPESPKIAFDFSPIHINCYSKMFSLLSTDFIFFIKAYFESFCFLWTIELGIDQFC